MIYVVNGPNLNLLGSREPEKYGNLSLEEINLQLEKIAFDHNEKIVFFQNNSEGKIIDFLQSIPRNSKVVLNPGALAHTSISLRDCIVAMELKVIEVHITNIFAREAFRQQSFISPVSCGIISGLGSYGYILALNYFFEKC